MLLHKGLINRELLEKILGWHHTGFNVHSKIRATTKREAEKVGKYMIRPLLSLKRLSIDETAGTPDSGRGEIPRFTHPLTVLCPTIFMNASVLNRKSGVFELLIKTKEEMYV